MKRSAAILSILVAAGSARIAHADALNGERYLVCHAKTGAPPAPTVAAAPAERRRVPKRRAPSALDAAETIVIDVPIAEARPGQRRTLPALEEPKTPERTSDNDFRCLGFARGRAGMVRVLGAPVGARFRNHPYAESWVEDNMKAAGMGHVTEAIPYLRRELARPIPDEVEPHTRFVRLELRRSAASALADLGDRASIPAMLAFLRAREKEDFPGLWEDSLDALARLDPAAAEAYALEVLERVAAEPKIDVGAENRARLALRLVRSPSPRAVALLTPLADADAGPSRLAPCPVLGARIRAGDLALRDSVRPELSTDLRTQRAAHCYSELVAEAFPGRELDELDTLLYRHRYEELIRLVARRGRLGGPGADVAAARVKLKKWLDDRKTDPEVAGDATDRRASSERRALYLALAAALGDAASERALARMIEDPKDDGAGPWFGARAALDLGLDHAADLAARRLGLASSIASSTVGHGGETWRGAINVNEHVEVVDRLAALGDPRFALGLLDRDPSSRRAAAAHAFTRDPKTDAKLVERICEVVATGAQNAERGAVEDAFWALTAWGGTCAPAIRRVAGDRTQPEHARGMALEYLAMVRATSSADAAERGDDLKQARARARIILASPE